MLLLPEEAKGKGIEGLDEEEEARRFEAKTALNCSKSAAHTGAPPPCPPPEYIFRVELWDFEKIDKWTF